MKDIRCTLDGDDPMKNINFMQKGIGKIRYNGNGSGGAAGPAKTNIGYHLLITQDVLGTAVSAARIAPTIQMATVRMCFTDA